MYGGVAIEEMVVESKKDTLQSRFTPLVFEMRNN